MPSLLTKHKIAYLTIDDGPSVDMIRKINFLESKGIKAVWFCRGDFLEQRPEHALYAIKKGHMIGNHAYSHPKFSDLSLEEAFDQIDSTDAIITDLYAQAETKWVNKFFRFPYGDKGDLRFGDLTRPLTEEGKKRKDSTQSHLKELKYFQPEFENVTHQYHRDTGMFEDVDWRWTFDVCEYTPFRPGRFEIETMEEVFERMDNDNLAEGREINTGDSEEIILVHDHVESSKFFESIIDTLLEKNLAFKNLN